MYKDLSLKEKAKVLQYGGKLGLTSVEDIAKLYDEAISHKYVTGGPEDSSKKKAKKLIENTKDTKYDPTIAFTEKSLIDANIKEYDKNTVDYVSDFFNSYANSEGVNRIKDNQLQWYSSYHPIRDRWYGRLYYGNPAQGANSVIKNLKVLDTNGIYEVDAPVANSKSVEVGNKKAIIIGNEKDREYDTPEGFVLPHELIHRLPDSKLRGAQADAIDRNNNTIINGHDELREEKYSDLQGLRLLLYNEGIYDSRGTKDATPEDIQKLRDIYPNLRPLIQMDNEKAAWMINHVVQNNTQQEELSHYASKGGPIVSPYGQWKYPGKDTIIPSNNITMDNVNYPVLGVSDTGDTKIMMPWNDYKFKGSMVYEHPLIGNQFQLGGNTKPTFDQWYPTVPNQKNDTSSYDLRRAYNTLPFDEMEKFRTINNYHLPSVAYDEKTDTYTFLKRNGHPTLNYELDWYNSGRPDAQEFRERYKLDTLSQPWRYIPNTFQTGGLVKKPEPIYNENGQVIGRRYVNKDNSKIIDSVVPQGRVNFQEFQKAKGKKARATNFEDLEQFQDSLIARGYNEPQRLAFLATSYNEMDNKGAASKGIGGNGYMGFNTIRMPLNLLNDSSKQIQYILDDTEKLTPDNWTDGGSGGPYIKNQTDAFNKFWNETNPNAATLILNKANIRPAKQSDWYLRASDADLMKQYMEYPELPKEEEQKQKKSNKLLDSFIDFILSGGLQSTPSYADGGNLFKKGGIYIKPENRGKFTALKKRTGHSASWFKAHGTPAQKKMATFALNAKKWNHKHDDGGYLYSEGGFLLAPYLYNE